jgi:uncharacterized membrane protein
MTGAPPTQPDTLLAYAIILMVALTVFAVRSLGVVGARFLRLTEGPARRVIDCLPGCALAAIVAPAAMRGSPADIASVALTLALYLWTGRTIVSLLAGLALCLTAAHWQAGSFG